MNQFIDILKEEWKEKPLRHKLIAIFGGIDTLFYMITPLIIVMIWGMINKENILSSWVLYFVGFFSATFRAFKIGWMEK